MRIHYFKYRPIKGSYLDAQYYCFVFPKEKKWQHTSQSTYWSSIINKMNNSLHQKLVEILQDSERNNWFAQGSDPLQAPMYP